MLKNSESIKKTALIIIPFVGVNSDLTSQIHQYKSSVASDRLQIQPLIQALSALNVKIRAISLNTQFSLKELNKLPKAELCIFTKLRPNKLINHDLFAQFNSCCALKMKREGSKIITLYSDHISHLDQPDGELYRNLLYLSDYIITPSKKLQNHAGPYSSNLKNIITIVDPSLLKRSPFKTLSSREQIRLIWFGSTSNLNYLTRTLISLKHELLQKKNYSLTIITSNVGIKALQEKFSIIFSNCNWSIRLIEWDHNNQPQQIQAELGSAHIALIPSDPHDQIKNGASHNRLIDSIESGCISIASPLDSYLELSKVALIGNNFSDLIIRAVEENERLCRKYSIYRDSELKRFSLAENSNAWEKILTQILISSTS